MSQTPAEKTATYLGRDASFHRSRTEQELRQTLSMLTHFIWHKQLRPGEHLWSIPVDKERDFDMILSDAIQELVQLRCEKVIALATETRLREAEGLLRRMRDGDARGSVSILEVEAFLANPTPIACQLHAAQTPMKGCKECDAGKKQKE